MGRWLLRRKLTGVCAGDIYLGPLSYRQNQPPKCRPAHPQRGTAWEEAKSKPPSSSLPICVSLEELLAPPTLPRPPPTDPPSSLPLKFYFSQTCRAWHPYQPSLPLPSQRSSCCSWVVISKPVMKGRDPAQPPTPQPLYMHLRFQPPEPHHAFSKPGFCAGTFLTF